MVVLAAEIDDFRNLRHVALQCSPDLNLIVGENASGKTSVVEALYFLGRARSFRTRQVRELIREGARRFRIVATLGEAADAGDRRRVTVGVERSLHEIRARIGGEPVGSLAQLASRVPVLLLNPDSHHLLQGGPQQRRRFMDWGLFHQNGAFMAAWKRYGAALRHRNAALRHNFADRSIDAWDEELGKSAEVLDGLRRAFCGALEAALLPFAERLLGTAELSVDYHRGWEQGQDLAVLLRAGRDQDRYQGYTRLGPHRSDFVVRLNRRRTPEYLSRGQQKLLVIALVLAQARLYRAHAGAACILLIDDLPSELDRTHRDQVMACLAGMQIQLFITAIEPALVDISAWKNAAVFRVDHGTLHADGAGSR